MSAQLYALGRWCFRNRLKVIGAWLALLVVLGGAAAVLGPKFDNAFEIPGSSSQEALRKLRMTFPQGAAVGATAIIVAPEGTDVNELRPQIEDAVAGFGEVEVVDVATSPWNEYVTGLVAEDNSAAIVQLQLNVTETPTDEELATITAAAEQAEAGMPEGTQVAMGGEAFNVEVPALSLIEAIGLVVALIVLLILLGSLVAAGLPLVTAIVGVGVAMAIMVIFSQVSTINSTTPMLAVMLGLAVGIDYALFILSRHRDQLREGMEVEESAARAVGTAGSAVVFAGVTVFIALLGLGVAGIPFLTVMGVFAAITIVFAVAIAITMLPAFMGLLGGRMRPRKSRRAAAVADADGEGHTIEGAAATKQPAVKRGGLFAWWAGVTTKHPLVTIVAVVVSLGALTIPGLSMQLSLPNAGQHEADAPDRIAYDLIAEHFGPGFNGPLVVTADIIGSTDPLGLVASLKSDIEQLDGVASVPLATPNPNADTALIQIIPTTASDDPATALVVEDLRELGQVWEERYGVSTAVTGYTAVQLDVTDKLSDALVPFAILVVGLSMVLLTAVFRSVWVPVKATVGYLLSVGAAFGATTLVFNEGWFKELVNLERGMPVISFLPILLMGILFGLAMDYEVFLVSRMREEYVHGKSAIEAIRAGFVASGPVVMAAAAIMFAVFAFFVPEGMGPIKQIAFALAVGVVVDALLIRMTFVPAVLALLGDRAWWLPRWLDKLLPSFDVEGEVLTKQLALAGWPGDGSVLHADELAVDGVIDGITMTAFGGNVIGIAGPVGARTGTALALSGRLAASSGRARVAGELLPEAATQVRRRTSYLDLAVEHGIADALSRIKPRPGGVVFIDSVDVVGTAAEREALLRLVDLARSGREFALVLCAAGAPHLEDFNPDGVVTVSESTLERSNA
ncbi:MMPL family transporter [Tessaracoccus sp. OS52]|uniref:MMPL family transporter n=1 Tax=Tessaracoccus sp. OS52 TaxID=2886691 RepID=UPI001D1260BF|nr:MMPL family transporter [Tessaracoccus sp. OS52]MCC2593663.1 MMPL family transporter [Tessaracoccus sp. OS52]